MNEADPPERLQKLLAAAGLGSRRTIEQWIRDGRVSVNGKVAQLGARASHRDLVAVDGRTVAWTAAQAPIELLIYHKPLGEVTTRADPQGRPTVFARLPKPAAGRWIVIGRLDVNTSGLLLFTTDGELAHRLMHPSGEVEREYLVRLRGRASPAVLAQLQRGVQLDDGPAKLDRITEEPGSDSHGYYRVVLHEGRNREVRRIWQAVGHEVSRLTRLRYGPIELPRELRAGQWRIADAATIGALQRAASACAA